MQPVTLAAKGGKQARTAGLQSLPQVSLGCHLLARENGHTRTPARAHTTHV